MANQSPSPFRAASCVQLQSVHSSPSPAAYRLSPGLHHHRFLTGPCLRTPPNPQHSLLWCSERQKPEGSVENKSPPAEKLLTISCSTEDKIQGPRCVLEPCEAASRSWVSTARELQTLSLPPPTLSVSHTGFQSDSQLSNPSSQFKAVPASLKVVCAPLCMTNPNSSYRPLSLTVSRDALGFQPMYTSLVV